MNLFGAYFYSKTSTATSTSVEKSDPARLRVSFALQRNKHE